MKLFANGSPKPNFVDYSDKYLYKNMEAKRITINQAKKYWKT